MCGFATGVPSLISEPLLFFFCANARSEVAWFFSFVNLLFGFGLLRYRAEVSLGRFFFLVKEMPQQCLSRLLRILATLRRTKHHEPAVLYLLAPFSFTDPLETWLSSTRLDFDSTQRRGVLCVLVFFSAQGAPGDLHIATISDMIRGGVCSTAGEGGHGAKQRGFEATFEVTAIT